MVYIALDCFATLAMTFSLESYFLPKTIVTARSKATWQSSCSFNKPGNSRIQIQSTTYWIASLPLAMTFSLESYFMPKTPSLRGTQRRGSPVTVLMTQAIQKNRTDQHRTGLLRDARNDAVFWKVTFCLKPPSLRGAQRRGSPVTALMTLTIQMS